MKHAVTIALSTLAACACAASGVAAPLHVAPSAVRWHASHRRPAAVLQHIVVVIQENRTVDNLFNGFCVASGPCADTVTTDPVSGTPLVPESLAAPYGASHSHGQFVLQYDGGKMDGFAQSSVTCSHHTKPCPYSVFAYVPASETQIYRQMASVDGVLADETFQTNQGPSLPAHIYAIAGQSGGDDADHWALETGSGSCGTTKPAEQILMTSPYPGIEGNPVPPCKDFSTIFDLLTNAGHTWRYYSKSAAGWWSATQNIQHLYNSANFVMPSTRFLTDVANGALADVSFVMPPTGKVSDHPQFVKVPSAGPNWVASVVNAIGETPYWQNTAIVVWWDDWGGWFDHVPPPASPVNPDPFEYGFRVPLVVASAYANVGTIDHTTRTFVSALRLIEETFGLGSLGTTDQYEPDGLDPLFNFNRPPIAFTPLGGSAARPFRHVAAPRKR